MDAQDLQDITNTVVELADQTCTVSRGATPIGTFDCIVFSGSTMGGAGGSSPDARDASPSSVSDFELWMTPDAIPLIDEGDGVTTSSGLILTIASHDGGASFPAFVRVQASKQTSSLPPSSIVFTRWNAGTLTWEPLTAQAVRIAIDESAPRATETGGGVRESNATIIGTLDLDIQAGDRFAYDGGFGTVTAVYVSDRTEASAVVRW